MLKWLLMVMAVPIALAAGFVVRGRMVRHQVEAAAPVEAAPPPAQVVLLKTVERVIEKSVPPGAGQEAPAPFPVEPPLLAPPPNLKNLPFDQVVAYEKALQARAYGYFQERFEQQTRDPVWRSATEDRLRGTFDTIKVDGVDVRELDCRSTMCRTKLATQSRDAGRAFVSAFVAAFVPGLEHHFSYGDDGAITVFSFRRDDSMPAL